MNTSRPEAHLFLSRSPRETTDLAARLGRLCEGGVLIGLRGDLGAGKTHFVKGLAAGLDIDPREVTSPTFLLIHELMGRLPLVHMDAYRVSGAEELLEAGAADLIAGDRVVAIEWAERVPDLFCPGSIEVDLLAVDETTRRIEFSSAAEPGLTLLDRLFAERREATP
jgi:tRNA threonylcarbamoyladenosine biosynthesis protein TsaE